MHFFLFFLCLCLCLLCLCKRPLPFAPFFLVAWLLLFCCCWSCRLNPKSRGGSQQGEKRLQVHPPDSLYSSFSHPLTLSLSLLFHRNPFPDACLPPTHYNSYIVVKGVGRVGGAAPTVLSELEFTVDRQAIDQSLAYLAER